MKTLIIYITLLILFCIPDQSISQALYGNINIAEVSGASGNAGLLQGEMYGQMGLTGNRHTGPREMLLSHLSRPDTRISGKKTAFEDSTFTDAVTERFLSGMAADDNFGYSVSSAGDVNGDGFSDLIVGAPYNDHNGVDAGRAYIFFGGMNFNSTPDVILTGGAAGYLLGYSVAGAGDLNGDSYDDVIVGASGYNTNQGRAFIYFGGANMNTSADLILTGEIIGDYFGYCVAGAGDLNGDGFTDAVASAPYYSSSSGKVYVYYGGSSMNNTADVTITGAGVNYLLGKSVAGAGDMNGDGYADLLAGAPAYNSNQGRAYLFTGGAAMDNIADLTITGSGTGYLFGGSVSSAGDFNGDGFDDMVIGANGYSSNRGRAYVYFGSAVLNGTADVSMFGEATSDNYGYCVSSAGDFDCDGFDDIIIGAYGYSSSLGKAYLYKGGELPDDNADKFLNGEVTGDAFGFSVSSCGDINGDGNDDIAVGAYLNDLSGTSSGRAYVFMNSMAGPDLPDLTYTGVSGDEFTGFSVASAGDVNGDGFDDVIAGAFGYNAGTNAGRAYIFFGGAMMNNSADVILTGVSSNDYFGISVSTAGDVNGDGYDDVIVGADGYNGGTFQGRAYIYFGGSSMNNTVDVTLTGGSAGDHFGFSVSDAGDVNSDGFDDVVVGAYGYNAGTDAGRIYVFFGGASMNTTADMVTGFANPDMRFGESVSGAGDVNGDGFDDIIEGGKGLLGGSGEGSAFVFFGGYSMDIYQDVTLNGSSDLYFFGYSVSEAGDVNGDGYDDFIVGAIGYNAGTDQGRAYLYYGGHSINTTADVLFTGVNSSDRFGQSVSSAGDVNGDGYADVIIGSYMYPSGYAKGKSYLYFGGISMNNTVDISHEGEFISDYFGVTVSGAGDLNGDGLDDVIIGAPYYESNSRGKIYVYFSTSPQVSPAIIYAKDVPFDQGGKIALRWMRSGYDAAGQNLVTSYRIEMSEPPSGCNYSWELAGSVTATNNVQYQYTANTPADSMSGNSGVVYYRITAVTNDPDQFWRSNIVHAYSVDNLAPLPPANVSASADVNSILVEWDNNLETDLHNYIIYRNGAELATTAEAFFDDTGVQEDSSYTYTIAAEDIHGNISELSLPVNLTFNNYGNIVLTLVMEGMYDASLNKMNMNDTIRLYLRSASPPYTTVDSCAGLIGAASLNGSFNFMHAATGSYYLAIKHRNTIETWSASPVAFTQPGTTLYDFTSSASKAFGANMKQVDANPVRFAVYSGDVNQDGTIDGTDLSLIDNAAYNFTTGYSAADLTGDDFVDATDFSVADNNAPYFISVIRP